jgi:hypothetical protein
MALGELSKILRLAEGPGEPLGFDNTVGVIRSSEQTVGAQELSTNRSRAAESEGIRAAYQALEQIRDTRFRDDQELVRMLNEARASLDSLYASAGPFHDDAADQALRMIDGLVRRINSDFDQQTGGGRAH